MFSALKSIFSPPVFQVESYKAYASIIEQSRKPFPYKELAVPDTLDGRFDVIVLHMFMVIFRLRRENTQEAGEFNRALQEVFFSDMDRSLREMGSSDTGVGKRIKKMAQAFYGRIQAYEEAMQNPEHLKAALKRNLYRDADVAQNILVDLEAYILRNKQLLAAQKPQDILQGIISFSD